MDAKHKEDIERRRKLIESRRNKANQTGEASQEKEQPNRVASALAKVMLERKKARNGNLPR